ncbi:hypothetical protein GGR51DRAFT_500481 [Nemania sp. FL0031]|nr:hypothetical protein GGR51DRAFT_500481 [Nemania sp. FL0031]
MDYTNCSYGYHSCAELSPVSGAYCCPNDRYCYLDQNWESKCCSLGVQCPGPCDSSKFYCNTTTGADGVAQSACCSRTCLDSQFSCPGRWRDVCCDFNHVCGVTGIGDATCVPAQDVDNTTSSLILSSSTTNSVVSSASSTADARSSESRREALLPVGLGVGIPSTLVFIGALVLLRMRVFSSKKKINAENTSQERFEKAELSGLSSVHLVELPETGYYELEACEKPRELPGGLPHEMLGSGAPITKNINEIPNEETGVYN